MTVDVVLVNKMLELHSCKRFLKAEKAAYKVYTQE